MKQIMCKSSMVYRTSWWVEYSLFPKSKLMKPQATVLAFARPVLKDTHWRTLKKDIHSLIHTHTPFCYSNVTTFFKALTSSLCEPIKKGWLNNLHMDLQEKETLPEFIALSQTDTRLSWFLKECRTGVSWNTVSPSYSEKHVPSLKMNQEFIFFSHCFPSVFMRWDPKNDLVKCRGFRIYI